MSHNVVAMILAGGKGTRLGLLTKKMAKPAVSFAAKLSLLLVLLPNIALSISRLVTVPTLELVRLVF